ncbi:MAG TPA: histidine phosphatase family protein [bacterium]|nr:histidine phosphatase family protein [bacterium]
MAQDKRRIYLIRHGETEFNRMGIFRGRFEVDLNERGRKQAGEIAQALEAQGLEILYSGPLRRARETAEIIGRALGIKHVVDEAFNNISLGKWQGLPKTDVMRDYPELWRQWETAPERLLLPGGETVEEVKRRAYARVLELVRGDSALFGATIGIVTHRSVMKGLAAAFLRVPPPYFWKFYIDNAAYSVFDYDQSGFTLVSWNNNSHLSEMVTEVF